MHENFKHYKIFSRYPWINPDINCTPPYLVIGDDLDSLLSAALWNHASSRDWIIIGIYHKYSKIFTSTRYSEDLEKAIWLDLDINSWDIKSLGHHLILDNNSRLPGNNHLNLNYLRNVSLDNFKQKYPLGTIHFLMFLFNQEIPQRKYAREMILSADSSWINGQPRRFHENVKDWIYQCLPLQSLQASQNEFGKLEFEKSMQQYFDYLNSNNVPQGAGQVSSEHLKLTGYQFQFDPGQKKVLNNYFTIIENITGWCPPKITNFDKKIMGTRKKTRLNKNKSLKLSKIIESDRIFSYVFPKKGYINYTIDVNLNSG